MIKRPIIKVAFPIVLFLFVTVVLLSSVMIYRTTSISNKDFLLQRHMAKNIVSGYARLIEYGSEELYSRNTAKSHLDNSRQIIMLLKEKNCLVFDEGKGVSPRDYICGLTVVKENNKEILIPFAIYLGKDKKPSPPVRDFIIGFDSASPQEQWGNLRSLAEGNKIYDDYIDYARIEMQKQKR